MASLFRPVEEALERAEQLLKNTDHLVYVTYPLIKEQRLLGKMLEYLCSAAELLSRALIEHSWINKRIDSRSNEHLEKASEHFGLSSDQVNSIVTLLKLMEQRQNAIELIRKDKLVIVSENFHPQSFGLPELKTNLFLLKGVASKIKKKLSERLFA